LHGIDDDSSKWYSYEIFIISQPADQGLRIFGHVVLIFGRVFPESMCAKCAYQRGAYIARVYARLQLYSQLYSSGYIHEGLAEYLNCPVEYPHLN
jgi:hypothetical protein